MKIVRTVGVLAVLVFAVMLWITRDEDLISQSAYALSPNRIWYILMHLSIMFTFALDAAVGRRHWGWATAIASAGTLAFNMYDYSLVHNIFTAGIVCFAVFNIIYYSIPKNRVFAIVNSGTGTLIFLLGVLADVNIFFAEVAVEFCIAVGMLRRIWNIK